MRFAFTLTGALLLASIGLLTPPASPWESDYEAALQRAGEQQKPLIAYFFTRWCGYCAEMERTTLVDPRVKQAMHDDQVWLKLNAEDGGQGSRLAADFSVRGFPTILILRSDGQEVDRREGYLSGDQLVEVLNNPPEKAFADLRQAALESPDSVEAQFELGEAHLERGELDQALAQFEKVIDLDFGDQTGKAGESLYYSAHALAAAGQTGRALEAIARLADIFPQSKRLPEAIILKGQILYYRGEPRAAREVFTRFMQDFPGHLYRPWAAQLLSEIEIPDS